MTQHIQYLASSSKSFNIVTVDSLCIYPFFFSEWYSNTMKDVEVDFYTAFSLIVLP